MPSDQTAGIFINSLKIMTPLINKIPPNLSLPKVPKVFGI